MDQKMFEQIASSITVKSICTPLSPDIRAGDKVEDLAFEARQSLDSNPDNPWPVRDNDGEVGFGPTVRIPFCPKIRLVRLTMVKWLESCLRS